ncbi:MAG: DEAD/DEAH box helicase family protein [Saprospiraceae bacterium]
MPNRLHTEKAFEDAIEAALLSAEGGWQRGDAANFSRQLALDENVLFAFLEDTQADQWRRLEAIHRGNARQKFLERLDKELSAVGMLDVLRNGITDNGVQFKLAYFKPAHSLNPETERLYNLNRLTVTRQVKYSLKNENSVDLLLSLNGLPVATVELKNQFTGQDTANARRQFIEDRDPAELLFQFKKRALVHFAVDTDEAYFTTFLNRGKTRFFPFNKGNNNGAGNPLNPNGHKTAYLWEEIWQKDSWLDIVGRFIHLETETKTEDGKKRKEERIIFPRYHQLTAVRELEADAKAHGTGKNYLIQHSAGSGKSNSIAWLSYRLYSLHGADNRKVFNSVVVITDRRVLDKQLQDTIFQFEHKTGVVQKIDQNTGQLRDALIEGNSIIITTLQKFPFVLESIARLAKESGIDTGATLSKIAQNKYAVIIDEAHSSQSGESTKKMKSILGGKKYEAAAGEETEDAPDEEDFIRQSILDRGRQPNISFFAFTATPKAKTLEVFGENGEPSQLYSMRQAIEEGFILDVLKHYMTYKTYFKLSKAIEDDPEVNKKKASRAIARFVSLHPYNLAQKTEVMIEHFRQVTSKKIGGKAKAMVVTDSRLNAVRYFFEFKKYLKEKGYSDIKPLVAFSGKVQDPDIPNKTWTETELNGFGEKELPERFKTDEFQLLLVADKYQTGFDQPLLHTMYVDKKLSGVKAVQTLSRLNRTHAGKEDTFVLDFANEREEILNSFQPYYEITLLEEPSDPNRLYDLKREIESAQVIWQSEVDNFCREYYSRPNLHQNKIHALMNAYVDPAVQRFAALDDEEQKEDFKNSATSFVNAYAYLSQIMPFEDVELEKFYTYCRFLLLKLPKKNLNDRFKLKDEVSLEYYRLQKISEGSLVLEPNQEYKIKAPKEAGLPQGVDEYTQLSEIIQVLNERFGTDFTEAERFNVEQIQHEMANDEILIKQALNNSFEVFKQGSSWEVFNEAAIRRAAKNSDFFNKILGDEKFAKELFGFLVKPVYQQIVQSIRDRM